MERESFGENQRRELEIVRRELTEVREERAYDRKERNQMREVINNLVREGKKKDAIIEQNNAKGLVVPDVLYVSIVPGKARVPCCVLRDVKTASEMSNSKMKGSYFIPLDWLDNIIHGRYTGSSYFNFSPFDYSRMNRFR